MLSDTASKYGERVPIVSGDVLHRATPSDFTQPPVQERVLSELRARVPLPHARSTSWPNMSGEKLNNPEHNRRQSLGKQ